MEDARFLLTEKYQKFSKQIGELYEIKKSIEKALNEGRETYNKLVTVLIQLDRTATLLQDEFEEWKKECITNNADS